MVVEVYTGQHRVSISDDLVARTSQCVAVGIVDSTQDLGGIAHIHTNTDHEAILDALIKELMSYNGLPRNYRIALGGGVDTFVPNYGFIPGRANADRVIEHLIKNGLESAIAESDLYEDYVRKLFVYISKRHLEIKRVDMGMA
jgi:chemotaxis receptor (MCP) glutamine deamidase CheD